MCDFPGKHQFLFESPEHLGIASQLGTNGFQRYKALEFVVVGLVDGPHPAGPENFKDFKTVANNVSNVENRGRVYASAAERCPCSPRRCRAAWCSNSRSIRYFS